MSNLLQKQQYILEIVVQRTDLTLTYEKLDGRNTFEPLIRSQDTLGEGHLNNTETGLLADPQTLTW